MAVFETVEERESHHISRRSNPCPDRSGQVELDGFTEVQMEALRKTRVADSQDGWDQIWNEVVKRRSPKPFQTTRSPLIRDEVKELFAILSELISPHSQDIVGRIRGIHPLPETAIRGALPVPQHLDWYEALIRDAWKEFIKFSTENPLSDVANTFPEDQDRTPTSPANAGHGNAGPQGSLPRETPGPSHNSIRQFGSSNWDAESQTPHTLFGSSQQSGLPPTGLSDISSGFGNSYNSSITTFTSDTHYEAAPDSRREARRSRDPQSFLNPRIHRHSTPSSSMSRPIIGMGVSYHRGQEEDPYPLSPQNNFGNMVCILPN
jgi:hypothetical protein